MENLYERMRRLGSEERYVHEFRRKQALLERLSYVKDGVLLPRGEICREIHTQELLVTELIFAGVFHEFDIDQIAALAVASIMSRGAASSLPSQSRSILPGSVR